MSNNGHTQRTVGEVEVNGEATADEDREVESVEVEVAIDGSAVAVGAPCVGMEETQGRRETREVQEILEMLELREIRGMQNEFAGRLVFLRSTKKLQTTKRYQYLRNLRLGS